MYKVGDRFIMTTPKGVFGYQIIKIDKGRIVLKPDDSAKMQAYTDTSGLDLHIRMGIFKKCATQSKF